MLKPHTQDTPKKVALVSARFVLFFFFLFFPYPSPPNGRYGHVGVTLRPVACLALPASRSPVPKRHLPLIRTTKSTWAISGHGNWH